MPKPMYVWSGSAWVSVASEVESLANYATVNYADTQPGSKLVVPTSVAVGSGSASINTAGQVSFSGASSVSLNDVFSSTYDNYKVIFKLTAGGNTITLRLRASGSDVTSNYQSSLVNLNFTGAASLVGYNSTALGTTSFWVGNSACVAGIDVVSPFLAEKTNFLGLSRANEGNTIVGQNTNTISYTGFTLITDTSTMTGTVAVYGYKD